MSESSVTTKLFAAFGAAVVISFAAIIAGVGINIPSRQHPYNANTEPYSSGANAWLIVATAMGILLSPALAFLYGTLNGSNISELVRNVTVVGSLVTFLWILWSFSLTYGEDAKGNGIIGYPLTYYFYTSTFNTNAALNNAANITTSIFSVYELGFALVTATLVTISLAGRVNLNSFMIYIFVWHLIVYTPIAHVVWSPNGAIYTNWIRDFSGALVVHILSSATSISLHLVLGKDEIPKAGPVANPEKAFYLTFVVWFLWFGFNAGKAHDANPVATQSIVNTIAATFSSILISFFYNLVLEKPVTPVSLSNAILIGLVGITPASGFVTVGGAMVIAIFTYLFTAVVGQFFIGEGFNTNESFSTLTIHSVAGTVGFIWTAIISYHFINTDGYNGLTAGRGIPLGYQIAALLAVWACSFIATYVLAWIVNLISPLKSVQAYDGDYKAPEGQQEAAPEQNVELTQV
jgi:ammonium transporter, Amt family